MSADKGGKKNETESEKRKEKKESQVLGAEGGRQRWKVENKKKKRRKTFR